jgi:hypothetical protein
MLQKPYSTLHLWCDKGGGKVCPTLGRPIRTVSRPAVMNDPARKNRAAKPWRRSAVRRLRRNTFHIVRADLDELLRQKGAKPLGPDMDSSAVSGMADKAKGGRPRDPETEEVYKFCFERFVAGDKLSLIRSKAYQQFGERAPHDDAAVRLYAQRYAKRTGQSLHRRKP